MSESKLLGFVPLLIGFKTDPPNDLLFQYLSNPGSNGLFIYDDGPPVVAPSCSSLKTGLWNNMFIN